MNLIILLIILVALICLTIGPAFGVAITRGFWVFIFIALVVAVILTLVPLVGIGAK
jgi:pheromone shutdown protein TraB